MVLTGRKKERSSKQKEEESPYAIAGPGEGPERQSGVGRRKRGGAVCSRKGKKNNDVGTRKRSRVLRPTTRKGTGAALAAIRQGRPGDVVTERGGRKERAVRLTPKKKRRGLTDARKGSRLLTRVRGDGRGE